MIIPMASPLSAATLQALRTLAEQATKGPWKHLAPRTREVLDGQGRKLAYVAFESYGVKAPTLVESQYTAEFIAACDPQTILQLLDRHDALLTVLKMVEDYLASSPYATDSTEELRMVREALAPAPGRTEEG